MEQRNSEELPQWTEEEFLRTVLPFQWIFEHANDDLSERQAIGRVKAYVQQQKFKCVGSIQAMYNSYKRSVTRQPQSIVGNGTAFEGQPMELACGKYICDSGVYIEDPNNVGTIEICPHPIMPTKRLVNLDTGEHKTEIAFSRSGKWQRIIVDRTMLANNAKIIDLAKYGIAVNSENAKLLVKYLSEMEVLNYDELPERQSISRLGWVNNGFAPFVDNLVFDGEDNYRHIFAAIKPHGSREKWYELARRVRAEESLAARIALASAFASVMIRKINGLCFIVHLWGQTGSGKTVALMLASSVAGDPSEAGEYLRSFNGTLVSHELRAGFLHDILNPMDELQVIKGNAKDFDNIVYMLCEGTGKSRGSKLGGLQKQTTWQSVVLSTGEMPITNSRSGGGAVNRVIDINCEELKLFSDPRDVANTVRETYGHALKDFVKVLADPDNIARAKSNQKLFARLIAQKGATEKQALAASILLAADELATAFLFQDGRNLTVQDILPFLVRTVDVDTNLRAYKWLADTVASNPSHFEPKEDGTYNSECWGSVEDDGLAYIIKAKFDDLMASVGFSAESFLDWADRQKLLLTDKGRKTKTKRLSSSKVTARTVCINLNRDDSGATVITDDETCDSVQDAFQEQMKL